MNPWNFRHAVIIVILLAAPLKTSAADRLTLREAVELTLKNSPQIRTAAHNTEIAKETIEQANSSYLPRVDIQGGYTALLDPQGIKMPTGSFDTQDSTFPFLSASVQQTIYDFGRREKRKEQAYLAQSAVSSGFAATRQDLAMLTVRTYFAILQAGQLITTASDEVVQREQHLKMATSLFEEGVTTRNDLLQAEVKLAASRLKLMSTRTQLKNLWLQMNNLTGQPPEYLAELAEEATTSTVVNSREITARDELAAQRSVVNAAESAVQENREEFFPELFVRGNIDYLKNSKMVEQTMYGVTVGVKINLFDGFATTSRQRQAVKQLEREKDRLREMESAYRVELASARNDLEVAAERIEITRKAISQSEENLRINSDRYKAQVGTATDVVDAQTLLSQAKSDHFQALYDFQVARARVKRATGEL